MQRVMPGIIQQLSWISPLVSGAAGVVLCSRPILLNAGAAVLWVDIMPKGHVFSLFGRFVTKYRDGARVHTAQQQVLVTSSAWHVWAVVAALPAAALAPVCLQLQV